MPDPEQGLCRKWLELHQELEQDLRIWLRSVLGMPTDFRSEKRNLRVLSLSVLVFGEFTLAQLWLCRPRSAFDGKSPMEVLQMQGGCLQVTRFLMQVLHGVYL